MALYFIEYDLRDGHRDYQELYDELERFNAVRVLESSWCFTRIKTTAANLRDHFKQFIDSDDGICITAVTDWATVNVLDTPNNLHSRA